MKAIQTAIADLLIIEPKVFGDERGFFFESFNRHKFAELVGREVDFVQDNHSRSAKNVLRGLHYQIQNPQGKLVRVVQGAVLDVAVDIRRSSPTFGQHLAIELSAENKRMLWIPAGFAHGFVVITETAEFCIKQRITGFRSMSVASSGMIRPWRSIGSFKLRPCSPPRICRGRRLPRRRCFFEVTGRGEAA